MDVDYYNLLNFPDEILLHIFGYFDDQSLLSVTRVCKRFKRLTEEAVAIKYDGKSEHDYYEIEEFEGTKGNVKDEVEPYRPFLMTFASKINAVRAIFICGKADKKHWIIRLLKRHLKSASKVSLQKSHNYFGFMVDEYVKLDLLDVISLFPVLATLEMSWIEPKNSEWAGLHICSLEELNLNNMLNLGPQTFQHFLGNNRQLQMVTVHNTANIIIDLFDDLSNLKTLDLSNDGDADESMIPINEKSKVYLPNLLSIGIENRIKNLFEVIGAGCKNIKTFQVDRMNVGQTLEINDHQVNILCSLKKLSKIWMNGVSFNLQQVKKIITDLPNLSEIEFAYNGDISYDKIGNILEKTRQNPKLFLIEIHMITTWFESLPTMSKIHQAFKHFASPNITLKMTLGPWRHMKTVVITNQKIVVNGKLMHWAAHPEIIQPSEKLAYVQLNDKCLEIVINQLNFGDQLALYQTCAKMQKHIGPKLQSKYALNSFSIQRDLRLEETYLRFFGKFLTRIGFDYKCCDDDQASKHWNLIHQYCRNTLNELTVKHLKNDQDISNLNGVGYLFPNLKKLTFVKSKLNIFHTSELICSFCPNITHLEFDERSEITGESMIMENAFDNLTMLRFGRYCDAVGLFLGALNQIVCDSLLELTLVNVCDTIDDEELIYKLDNGILNTVARFKKLKKLDLILGGIEQTNMKFLFESCSNLVELSICLVFDLGFPLQMERLKIVKKSCIHLKKLKLVIILSDAKYFVEVLRKYLGIFPGISIEVLEMNGESFHHVKKYNLTYQLLNHWDKSPIQAFLSATN